MSINEVIISGNIVADAQLNTTTGKGTKVLNISVAVNDRRKNQETGEWEEHPNFIDCSMFGPRAESLAPYLLKGTKVAITGALRQSTWEDKETGKNRSRISVLINNVEFMSQRNSNNQGGGGQAAQAKKQESDSYDTDDVPF